MQRDIKQLLASRHTLALPLGNLAQVLHHTCIYDRQYPVPAFKRQAPPTPAFSFFAIFSEEAAVSLCRPPPFLCLSLSQSLFIPSFPMVLTLHGIHLGPSHKVITAIFPKLTQLATLKDVNWNARRSRFLPSLQRFSLIFKLGKKIFFGGRDMYLRLKPGPYTYKLGK